MCYRLIGNYLKQVAQAVVSGLAGVGRLDRQIEGVTPAFGSRRDC
jgi:hypothetical protein